MGTKRERLRAYTERAIEATEAGALIPPIVYLPRRLRQSGLRLTEDNLCLKVDAPTLEENHVRLAGADPLGFLIAGMNGQPIPAFEIGARGDIVVRYEVLDLDTRLAVAKWLANKNLIRVDVPAGRRRNAAEHVDREYRNLIEGAEGRAALAAANEEADV